MRAVKNEARPEDNRGGGGYSEVAAAMQIPKTL